MNPGIYRNLPEAEYHAIPGASSHRLGLLERYCPLKAKWHIDNPAEPSRDMKIGTALHKRVIEGSQAFDDAYSIAPKVNKRTNAGKDELKVFEEKTAVAGKRVIERDDFETVEAMAASVFAHPVAGPMVNDAVERELSIVWTDPEFEVPCKCRLDMLAKSSLCPILTDLKKARDVASPGFDFAMRDYGYHRQMAWYAAGVGQVGLAADTPTLIGVEEEPPFIVRVAPIPERDLFIGHQQNRALLKIFADCWHSGKWPGYEGQDEIKLPGWYRKMMEKQEF